MNQRVGVGDRGEAVPRPHLCLPLSTRAPSWAPLVFIALGACARTTDDGPAADEAGSTSSSGSDASASIDGSTIGSTSTLAPEDASTSGSSAAAATESDGGTTAAPADSYTIDAFDRAWLSSVDAAQYADAEIELVNGPFASVRLVMDLESPCFPFSRWEADPPPVGENWPASCDAFDRIANLTADPDGEAFELLRTVTPFGGPQTIEADLTDWANARPGSHVLRGFVSTWADATGQVSGSAGGWFLSVRLEVTPGPPPRNVLAALPLFHGDVDAGASTRTIAFDLPEGTTAARIDYLVSGHGGGPVDADCIGPADEFCRREHTLRFDRVELGTFVPWRDDCVELCTLVEGRWQWTYCAENPCGSIASVRAPRANWCPGAAVVPTAIDLADLATPGPHTFELSIAEIGEGGVWRTMVTAYAYGD